MAKRPASGPRVTSAGEIGQLQFNDRAYAQRNLEVGGVYLQPPLGPIGAATRCGHFATLMIANTAATGAFVTFGDDASMAAPTGLADGYYLPPNSLTPLCSGLRAWVRASAATVGAYKLDEHIVVREDERAD